MNILEFKAITDLPKGLLMKWYEPLCLAMQEFDIYSKTDKAMFIAQTGHESGGFKHVVESLNYTPIALQQTFRTRISPQQAELLGRTNMHSAKQEAIANIVYGGRLGNNNHGDGWKYRGRGLIQITGLDNYRLCGKALNIDLVTSPQLLEESIYASRSAAWFYTMRGCSRYGDDLVRITRLINGGENGISDRRIRFDKALKVLSK
ncbi:glycoside hydrolase family 19 protein [Salmonella enterica]|nr:glycoside hydrolase family 19 protein [Salmonella enterica]EGA0603430.1 glycoside hydrolase family 19 protein [Salmonella enterica]EHD2148900.1 glycoside hydrolase family 19 protein [Salmonella enterica]EHK2353389.1 glycoside hydrolase family 19 protein [Salmonella enterica]